LGWSPCTKRSKIFGSRSLEMPRLPLDDGALVLAGFGVGAHLHEVERRQDGRSRPKKAGYSVPRKGSSWR